MNDVFSFERPDWELLTDALQPGSTLSAVQFLAALESEDEAGAEEAFEVLCEKKITLDLSRLPRDYGSGELEKQLRREEKLAAGGDLLRWLEEGDPLRLYLEELAQTPAQGDPIVLQDDLLAGDPDAGQKLLNLYLYQAVERAKEHTGRGVLLLDLIQEAGLGLWQGILRYEGGNFDSHVDWWIRHSLARVILLQAKENGLLRNMQAEMESYRQADQRLLTELGRNATLEEIALEMGTSVQQADVIRDMLLNAAAMERAKQPSGGEEQDDRQAVEDTAYFQSRQRVGELLSTLSAVEVQVLTLRFGLEGAAPASPEAVSAKLGITPHEVITMEAAALAKLRNK